MNKKFQQGFRMQDEHKEIHTSTCYEWEWINQNWQHLQSLKRKWNILIYTSMKYILVMYNENFKMVKNQENLNKWGETHCVHELDDLL